MTKWINFEAKTVFLPQNLNRGWVSNGGKIFVGYDGVLY